MSFFGGGGSIKLWSLTQGDDKLVITVLYQSEPVRYKFGYLRRIKDKGGLAKAQPHLSIAAVIPDPTKAIDAGILSGPGFG